MLQAALTRAQYLVGAGVTLALFLLFYVLFGALVLVQRWPRWKRLVAPRAVLARSQSHHLLDRTCPLNTFVRNKVPSSIESH